jgi:hypothetical protein
MSMKKPSDTIGNRTRDIPVYSAVPQPLRHRVHILEVHLSIQGPDDGVLKRRNMLPRQK